MTWRQCLRLQSDLPKSYQHFLSCLARWHSSLLSITFLPNNSAVTVNEKTTNIQDQGGSYWNNKWGELLSRREYEKKTSEDCKYYKFSPFSHYINDIKINVHQSVYFKCLRTRDVGKVTCSFAKSLISALCFQQLMKNKLYKALDGKLHSIFSSIQLNSKHKTKAQGGISPSCKGTHLSL